MTHQFGRDVSEVSDYLLQPTKFVCRNLSIKVGRCEVLLTVDCLAPPHCVVETYDLHFEILLQYQVTRIDASVTPSKLVEYFKPVNELAKDEEGLSLRESSSLGGSNDSLQSTLPTVLHHQQKLC